jgi:membrane protein
VTRFLGWRPVADLVLTLERANGLRFTRWAATIAMFGYLSLFPLLTLSFVVFSVFLSRAPDLQDQLQQFVADALPDVIGASGTYSVDLSETAAATVSAGVVGVLALLYAGLGWVDATIEGVRRMFGALRRPRNFVILKLEDTGWLIGVGGLLLVAVLLSLGVSVAGDWLFEGLGWSHGSTVLSRAIGTLVVVLLSAVSALVVYAFALKRPGRRWRTLIGASLMVGVVFELMSAFAALLVGRTLNNPVYGALAVAAAILLFLYFASIVLLFGACWVAVQEGRPVPDEVRAYGDRRKASSGASAKTLKSDRAGDDD